MKKRDRRSCPKGTMQSTHRKRDSNTLDIGSLPSIILAATAWFCQVHLERNMSDMFTVLSQTDLICILVFMTTCMQLRRGVVVTADGLFALEPPVPEQASRQPRELVVRGLGLASQFIRVPPTVRDVLEDGCKAVAGVAHRAALTHVERST
eukprot:933019-Pleurochrysis_carterae.AAC.2